jgi:hypothetical protein
LFTPTTVSFFSSASSQPFLLGSKLPHHTLWSLDIPSPIPCTLHAPAPCNTLKKFTGKKVAPRGEEAMLVSSQDGEPSVGGGG